MRKEIYIPDSESEVIDKLKKVGKRKVSSYIVNLIKDDLHGSKFLNREEVIALIMKYTQNNNTANQANNIDLESSIQSVLSILD